MGFLRGSGGLSVLWGVYGAGGVHEMSVGQWRAMGFPWGIYGVSMGQWEVAPFPPSPTDAALSQEIQSLRETQRLLENNGGDMGGGCGAVAPWGHG